MIAIDYRKPHSYMLGSAEFRLPASGYKAVVSVDADRDLTELRPITLYIATDQLRIFHDFTVGEAEALACCLVHATALRREAEAAAQAQKAA